MNNNDQIMQECPSFDSCSSPICSLDEFQDQRIRFPDENKCKSTKKTRLKIGIKYNLSNYGLTKREIQGIVLSYGSLDVYLKHFNNFLTMNKEKELKKVVS